MNHKRPTQPGPSTLSVHAGESRQKHANSITDPIFAASTYTFADSQSVIDYIEQKLPREEYGPTAIRAKGLSRLSWHHLITARKPSCSHLAWPRSAS